MTSLHAKSKFKPKTNKDLVRLDKFCKTAIETYQLNAYFAVQTIGTYLVFYLVEYVYSQLYVMMELDQVYFPILIEYIPMVWGFLR
ncbi:MAG: hypothetical protein EXX96DRAFT_548401 [Benjaminiella poitrasii]|nr:MAG: hypothetical protein EXX96DRAFT_548401 [Benjaminiella poitrasii]